MLAFDYAGQGLVPGFIDAQPREDLAAITFLGAQIAEQHPIVKDWNVGSPARVDLEKTTVSKGDYDPVRELGKQALYPMVQGFQDGGAVGMHGGWSDPLGLDRIGVDLAYSPDDSLPQYERMHFDALLGAPQLAPRLQAQRRRFLRPVRADQDQRARQLMAARLQEGADLRRAAHARSGHVDQNLQRTRHGTRRSRTSPRRATSWSPPSRGSNTVTSSIRSATSTTKKAYAGTSTPTVNRENGNTIPLDLRRLRLRLTVPVRSFLAVAAQLGRLGARQRERSLSRTSTSARSATTGSMTARSSATADYSSFPGFDIDELNGRNFLHSMLEWNLPPVRFCRIGSPGELPELGAAGSVRRRAVDQSERLVDCRARNNDVGFQVDFQFMVMHDQEMTFSIGSAYGFGEWQLRT